MTAESTYESADLQGWPPDEPVPYLPTARAVALLDG